jgi:hypothetical protein
MDYFLVVSALVSLAGSLLTGLTSAFFSVLAGAAGAVTTGAVATGAGVAGVAGALAGSAAKAVTAKAEAIKVAINFMISFLFG